MEEKENTNAKEMGRNEPCHCGSGKKYKRCHGVGAAPKLSAPKLPPAPEAGQMGFDPSKMDPAMMAQASAALQRLPKGQIQRLQSIMQKAMAGKDVSREAAELENTLPPDFRQMMQGMMGGMMSSGAIPTGGAPVEVESEPADMTPEQARAIVAKAVKEGKMSAEQAESLLAATGDTSDHDGSTPGLTHESSEEEKRGLSKLWRSVTGKK